MEYGVRCGNMFLSDDHQPFNEPQLAGHVIIQPTCPHSGIVLGQSTKSLQKETFAYTLVVMMEISAWDWLGE